MIFRKFLYIQNDSMARFLPHDVFSIPKRIDSPGFNMGAHKLKKNIPSGSLFCVTFLRSVKDQRMKFEPIAIFGLLHISSALDGSFFFGYWRVPNPSGWTHPFGPRGKPGKLSCSPSVVVQF